MLTPGTTDSCFFRQKGVNCYGLFPAVINPEELARLHGVDERISIDNLRLGTQITFEVLREICQPSS
jgi:acetylornithine deacetylase/succinyl-diaminopimelate desuccinylase-like protein